MNKMSKELLTGIANAYVESLMMYSTLVNNDPKAGDLEDVISHEIKLTEYSVRTNELHSILGMFKREDLKVEAFKRSCKNIRREIEEIETYIARSTNSRDILSYKENLAKENARLDVYESVMKSMEASE